MLDHSLIEYTVRPIPGWLEDYTALMANELLKFQERVGVKGPLLEIGVYAGKFFSVLLLSACRTQEKIIGLDTFQYIPVEKTREYLSAYCRGNYEKMSFIEGLSTALNSSALLRQLEAQPRFISVDGSHEKADVFWDLRIVEELTSSEGIVAVDDFLNPLTLGVNEAVNHFFQQPRNLVPFAYIANKLFLSRGRWAERYKTCLKEIALEDNSEPRSQAFQKAIVQSPESVEVKLFGYKILIWP